VITWAIHNRDRRVTAAEKERHAGTSEQNEGFHGYV
jgi:hypothetical protein